MKTSDIISAITLAAVLRRRAKAAEAERDDYKSAYESVRENVRKIDVAMHGEESAAEQASACDLIGPAKELRARCDQLQARVAELEALIMESAPVSWVGLRDMEFARQYATRSTGKMFRLEFETYNAAYDEDVFLATLEILEDVARDVRQRNTQGTVRDINGNSIGRWEYTP